MLSSRWAIVGLVLGLILVSTQPILDPDLGWHIATGRWILEHKTLPYSEPFAFSTPDHAVVAHAWLQDTVLAYLENHLGVWGIQLWYGLILIGIGISWAQTIEVSKTAKTNIYLLVLPLIYLMTIFVGLRTHLITILGLSLIQWYFYRIKSGQLLTLQHWGLHLLFVGLWAQMHAGVVIGVGFYFLWVLFLTLESLLSKTVPKIDLKRQGLIGLGLLGISLLNPYGTSIYTFAIHLGPVQQTAQFNQDWLPLLSSRLGSETIMIRLLLVVLAGLVALKTKSQITRILSLLFLGLSLWSIRWVLPLFVVLAPSVVGISIVYLQSFLKPKQLFLASFFIGLCTIALNWQHLLMTHCVNQSETCYAQHGGFPFESVQVLAQMSRPQQRIFNYYDWGGYLVWKLPQHQIFIDGRMDNYQYQGKFIMMDFAAVESASSDYQSVLETYKPSLILMPTQAPISEALKHSDDWQLIFTNPHESLFTASEH